VVPPVSSAHLWQRAERLYRLNRPFEALTAFELARVAAPEQTISAEALYRIGMAQYHARENNAAAATFRQLFERAPGVPLAPLALLMLARLHLRMGADTLFLDTGQALIAQFPGSKQAQEIGYLMGHFYRNRGRVTEAMQAFQQIVRHGKRSQFADDAWWYIGWLEYGLGQYQRAAQTWGKLVNTFPASSLIPEALYWQGRAFERLGRRHEARARYERLRSTQPQTYYGHLASARLTGLSPWPWEAEWLPPHPKIPKTALASPEPLAIASSNAHAVRAAELWAMRLYALAGEELQALPEPAAHALRYQWHAAQAFHRSGEHHRTLSILRRHDRSALAQVARRSAEDLQEMAFPLRALQRLDSSPLEGLDPRFIGALVMAESGWNPQALSRVGARGLMQLMPETGHRLARNLGIDLLSEEQLFDPSLNLRLGVTYIRELLPRFDHRLPLAVASFNAGEEEVSRWWAKRGNLDMEEFIANMPFRETRHYVQRVFVHYAAYRRVYPGLADY
jgi:soluble lytic murein transglycosylase